MLNKITAKFCIFPPHYPGVNGAFGDAKELYKTVSPNCVCFSQHCGQYCALVSTVCALVSTVCALVSTVSVL